MKHLFTFLCLFMLGFQANAQNCGEPLTCNNLVNFSLDQNGLGTITPDVILEGSFDPNCDYEISLMNGTSTLISGTNSLEIDCSFLGEFTLNIANNGSSCWGLINIEDIGQVCSTDVGPGNIPLSITYGNSYANIDGVDMNGIALNSVYSWLYAIPEADILAGENLIEFPESTNNSSLQNVSTLDIVLMEKMFSEGIEYPLRSVLSDVDGSNYFGVNDIVTTRELILGIINEFPSKNHIYFPSNYKFDSNFDAFDNIPNYREFRFSNDTLVDVSFSFRSYAYGDLSGATTVDSFSSQEVTDRNYIQSITIQDQMVEEGDIVSVPVGLLDESQNFIGLQMGIALEGATLLNVEHNYSALELMSNTLDDSNLRFSFLNAAGNTNMELTLELEIEKTAMLSEIISLNSTFKQELASYEENGTLNLVFSPATSVEYLDDYELRIFPNPMLDFTTILLPSSKEVDLEVLNGQGQILNVFKNAKDQINLSKEDLAHSGIYFIRVKNGDQYFIKKLVVL